MRFVLSMYLYWVLLFLVSGLFVVVVAVVAVVAVVVHAYVMGPRYIDHVLMTELILVTIPPS